MKSRGFSLIEISIVLVIIGLLVGGILAGRALIRASEIRSLIGDYNRFVAATNTFKGKYFYLPGDMPNATAFWGDNATACSDTSVANGNPGTCNGNGDNEIQLLSGGGSFGPGDTQEAFQFWNQLAQAELIEGQYDGVAGAASFADSVGGQNAPQTELDGVVWGVRSYTPGGTTAQHFNLALSGKVLNHFSVGSPNTTHGWPQGQFVEPNEAWGIDEKLDDGMPARGKVLSTYWPNCTDAADQDDLDAEYNLSNENHVCAFWMKF